MHANNPADTQLRIFHHGDRQIACREWGSGKVTLLFIHGWCCDQQSWRYQMAAFGGRFRCISLDLAGHGQSSPLAASSFSSLADMAADVNFLRNACAIDEVVLIGHSMGGPVAIEAAAAAPSGVLGVVGVDTFTDANMYAPRASAEIAERLGALEANFPGAIAGLLQMIVLADRQGIDVQGELNRIAIATPLPVALLSMQRLLEWDIDRRWLLPNHPDVHAINSRDLLKFIVELPERPHLTVHLLDEVGHYPMLEDPVAFNSALQDVLDRMQVS